ncbi:uncharacterized protein TNCT_461 [Trichonephila clavata]|uniref:Uncharacterized protein n=1 Tax=Trichonephila clavata TaxID=2740835 RepID=A0A8X6JY62_TRICU|nr:uncharacterized protein TNCT_461 [Trichonephila clavata]
MPDLPQVSNPPNNTEGCSSSTQNVSTADSLPSTSTDVQRPAQPRPGHDKITLVDQSADPVLESAPRPAQFSRLDIDTIIGNCELKSEEIPCLMAEKLPSSESDDSYGSFHNPVTSLKADGKNFLPFSEAENAPSCSHVTAELGNKLKLEEDTMQSWLAESSDDSTFHPCEEDMEQPLIDIENDSEMEEFYESKRNTKETQTNETEKSESFVDDLIQLNESPDEIVVTSPIQMQQKEPNHQSNCENNTETLRKNNQIHDSQAEKCAKEYMEYFKDVLNSNFPLQKNTSDNMQKDEVSRTVEEELQDAETNYFKRTVPCSLPEIGLPKLDLKNPLRTGVNEGCLKNIKKIGVYQNKYQCPLEESDEKCETEKGEDLTVKVIFEIPENPCSLNSRIESDVVSNKIIKEALRECPEDKADAASREESTPTDCIKDKGLHQKLFVEIPPEDPQVKTDKADAEKDEKAKEIKSILKNQQASGQKHVTFVENKGDLGMEHMGVHQENACAKIQETHPDLDTALRFMTEAYPSREDEEMLSESLNATLEPSALARPRKDSPRATELYEEIKILEGEESLPHASSVVSPERPEDKAVNKPRNKFSKFFKSFKRKIWN